MNYLYYSLTISFILIGSGCNSKINNEKTQKETKVLNENESFDANKVIMTCIPELIESGVDSISIQIVNNTQDVITFGNVYRIMVLKDYRGGKTCPPTRRLFLIVLVMNSSPA